MIRSTLRWAVVLICTLTVVGAQAQVLEPAQVYEHWIQAVKARNLTVILQLMSASANEEFKSEVTTDVAKKEVFNLLEKMLPFEYKVVKTEFSKDGKSASLWLHGTVWDFLTLNSGNPKKETTSAEIKFVKEDGRWKMVKSCWGNDGCGKEPDWQIVSFGKPIALGNGNTVTFSNGRIKDLPIMPNPKGKTYFLRILFRFPENSSLSLVIHRLPEFADFYLMNSGEKYTPTASVSTREGKSEAEFLKEGVSYSKNYTFTGDRSLTFTFSLPKDAKGPTQAYAHFKVGEEEFYFDVRD